MDAVKLLVDEYEINISAHDNEALSEAGKSGTIDIIEYIISHPDFNPDNCSNALISAVEWGDANIVFQILDLILHLIIIKSLLKQLVMETVKL